MSVESVPAAAQTIAGWKIDSGETTRCQSCQSHLGEGDEATVYAYRPAERQLVSVARWYCTDCDRREIQHPTLGCYEWLVEARLATTSDVATQSHALTLLDIEILDESPPEEDDGR
jgi:hypothetical protein